MSLCIVTKGGDRSDPQLLLSPASVGSRVLVLPVVADVPLAGFSGNGGADCWGTPPDQYKCLGTCSCSIIPRVTVPLPWRSSDPGALLGGVDPSLLTPFQFRQLHFISLNFSC